MSLRLHREWKLCLCFLRVFFKIQKKRFFLGVFLWVVAPAISKTTAGRGRSIELSRRWRACTLFPVVVFNHRRRIHSGVQSPATSTATNDAAPSVGLTLLLKRGRRAFHGDVVSRSLPRRPVTLSSCRLSINRRLDSPRLRPRGIMTVTMALTTLVRRQYAWGQLQVSETRVACNFLPLQYYHNGA